VVRSTVATSHAARQQHPVTQMSAQHSTNKMQPHAAAAAHGADQTARRTAKKRCDWLSKNR